MGLRCKDTPPDVYVNVSARAARISDFVKMMVDTRQKQAEIAGKEYKHSALVRLAAFLNQNKDTELKSLAEVDVVNAATLNQCLSDGDQKLVQCDAVTGDDLSAAQEALDDLFRLTMLANYMGVDHIRQLFGVTMAFLTSHCPLCRLHLLLRTEPRTPAEERAIRVKHPEYFAWIKPLVSD